jgi:hypothetical protein
LVVVLSVGCGKKGPPLPPLVKLPQPPADLTASRHGNTIDLQMTVPAANTDGTKPGNVASVEVYAVTLPVTPTPIPDAQVLKLATIVDSLDVKAPADPDVTVDPDDEDSADEEMEPTEGDGLDQGALAKVTETLTPAMLMPVTLPSEKKKDKRDANPSGPLLPPPSAVPVRTYISLGVTTKGKKGPLSKRVNVPLVTPPVAPAAPSFTYTETTVTVAWTPASAGPSPAPSDGLLPSKPLGAAAATIGYNVYDVSGAEPIKLTTAPVADTHFDDARIAWDVPRCYVVRTTATLGGLSIESDASPKFCDTLKDTFPPAAPKALNAVPTDGAISLIWDSNTEKDLAGYIVLRAPVGGELKPITPEPIQDPSFKDNVAAGVRYVYAVRAVDTVGNLSPLSSQVEETAR